MTDSLMSVAWTNELANLPPPDKHWLWQTYLKPGSLTLLTSQWKTGKTTLLALLLAQMKTGGEFLGLPVAAGKALVVTEESQEVWHQRHQQLGFGDQVCLMCRPFTGVPTGEQWCTLLDRLAELHLRFGFQLLVIDPLASFLPGNWENNAAALLNYLLPLRDLAGRGLSAFLLHHPRRKESPAGQSARGSGALSACVDILLELHWYRCGAEEDRRRRLFGWSRHGAIARQLVIELNESGTAYRSHGSADDEEIGKGWQVLERVLRAASRRLTLKEILEAWPPDAPRPSEMTLWRWLERARTQGRLERDGAGHKSDPHRFCLTGQEQRWAEQNPDYAFERVLEQKRKEDAVFQRLFQRD